MINNIKHIAIGGCGLMGGSIGLKLKTLPSPPIITGFGRTEATLQKALLRGAIDEYNLSPSDAVKNADLIILCAPVMKIPEQMTSIVKSIKKNAIVSDVGSTKTWIISKAEKIFPDSVRFVGSHPMTGSEKDGIDSADALLYEQAVTVVTPSKLSDEESILTVKDFWRLLGSIPVVLPSETHDRIVSSISHLPHVLAAAMVNLAAKRNANTPRTFELSAGGFRDTTRIASSNPNLWKDICLTNKDAIIESIQETIQTLSDFQNNLKESDSESLLQFFDSAKSNRDKMPAKGTGLLPSIIALSVEAPNKPGVIAELTGLLAKERINIIDIEVSRMREVPGDAPIRIFFENDISRSKASEVIKKAGYTIREL